MTDFWGFWVLFVLGFGFCVVFFGEVGFFVAVVFFSEKGQRFLIEGCTKSKARVPPRKAHLCS